MHNLSAVALWGCLDQSGMQFFFIDDDTFLGCFVFLTLRESHIIILINASSFSALKSVILQYSPFASASLQ